MNTYTVTIILNGNPICEYINADSKTEAKTQFVELHNIPEHKQGNIKIV